MRTCRILLMILFSLVLNNFANAASYLTLQDAKTLLGTLRQDEVPLWDGCCDPGKKHCCNENICGCDGKVCALTWGCETVGTISIISAVPTTASAYPCCGECCFGCNCPTVFSAAHFKAAMALWGWGPAILISPLLIIPGVNYLRNCIIRCSNKEINEKIIDLPNDLDQDVRLKEDAIFWMGDVILNSSQASLKKLDVGQVLTLALVDFERFKNFADLANFSKESNYIAIGLTQILAMTKSEQEREVFKETVKECFIQHPMFYVVLKKLLPAVQFPNIELDAFYDQFISGDKIVKKYYNYQSLNNNNVLIDLECEIVTPNENNVEAPIILLIEGKKIKASKTALTSLSSVLDTMFKDNDSDSREIPITFSNITAEDVHFLVYLSTFPSIGRAHLVKENNIEQLLKLENIFDIKFIKELCDNFCLTNGVPKKNAYEQLKFATDYHLKETKKRHLKALTQRLDNFVFDPADIQSIGLLTKEEREVLFNKFKWQELYKAFQFTENSKLIKTLWEPAKTFAINEITTKLIEYMKNETEACNVIAKAWGIFEVPKELQPDFCISTK